MRQLVLIRREQSRPSLPQKMTPAQARGQQRQRQRQEWRHHQWLRLREHLVPLSVHLNESSKHTGTSSNVEDDGIEVVGLQSLLKECGPEGAHFHVSGFGDFGNDVSRYRHSSVVEQQGSVGAGQFFVVGHVERGGRKIKRRPSVGLGRCVFIL